MAIRPLLVLAVLAAPVLGGCSGSVASSASLDEWIAFSSGRSGEGDIYAIHPTTQETRFIAGTPAPEGSPTYDAARDRIVYQRYEPTQTLSVAGAEVLFETPNEEHVPAWSPDGKLVAYVDVRDGQADVFVARADGSGERRLTDDATPENYPAWSPDSEQIVFARQLDSGWDLFSLDVSEGTPSLDRLTTRGVYTGHPAWSPDGRSIAFDTFFDDDNGSDIAVLDIVTGDVTRLTERPGNDLIPAWSPDGRHVAFGGDTDGDWDVWLLDTETLEIEQLTTSQGFDGGPVFVPASALAH